CGLGGAGGEAGRRPLQGRDVSGERRERLRGGRGLRWPKVAEAGRDVYFEFTAIGSSVKVVAIDSETGIEVAIVGPSNAAQADLERLARQKLKVRLARDQSEPGAR